LQMRGDHQTARIEASTPSYKRGGESLLISLRVGDCSEELLAGRAPALREGSGNFNMFGAGEAEGFDKSRE